jgi:hypothetical protein
MKKLCSIIFLAVAASFTASAQSFSYGGPSYPVPDGNPNGVWSSVSVQGAGPILADISVSLSLSGGYNGDLYAYLSFDGRMVPLLNRIGLSSSNPFGWNGPGLTTTLADTAASNIHAAGNGFLSGTYRPDGQNVSPLSLPGSFNAGGGTITLNGTFAGLNPNGDWSLFVADMVTGGNGPVVNGWSLNLTIVPEPSTLALVLLGLMSMRLWKSVPMQDQSRWWTR